MGYSPQQPGFERNRHALIQILHLEDSLNDAELIKSKLDSEGLPCEITHVRSKEEFQAALSTRKFDVILCDYNLQGYDGLTALNLVKDQAPLTPVMLISGTLGEEDAVKCLKMGATDYLLKDRLERLPAAIVRGLEERDEREKLHEAALQLRESEERFRQITENVADLIALLDLEGKRIYNNPAYRKLLGDSYLSQAGKSSFDNVHPDDRERIKNIFQETIRTGIGQRTEYRFIAQDGTVHFIEAQGAVIRNAAGEVTNVLVVGRDITERRKLEREMLRHQRLESIGTLAGGIAHDLNNALAPIILGMEILRAKYPAESKLIETMESSAKFGAGMVRQLLTFAKGVDGARLSLRPEKLLHEVQSIIKSTFPKNIKIIFKAAAGACEITGDATQIHQVLLNLCVNARDAMPSGGVLELEARNEEVDAVFAAEVSEAKCGKYVVFRVSDTGSGIPPEHLDRIFEPFFTTKSPDKGTGLGLSTTAGIVRSHGGFVQVHSTIGKGTTFSVYFPANDDAQQTVPSAEIPESNYEGDGETILVVDDDAAVRQTAQTLLTQLNFRVLTASDGTEALIKAAEKRSELQAVISDLNMPYMDGVTFVRALLRMLPGIGVIVTSGKINEQEMAALEALGAKTILHKPFSKTTLLNALKTILKK